MRLPLIPDISTKDGASNKNSRMFNVLAERRADGSGVASVRPGLRVFAQSAGMGNGVVCFGGEIVSIFGDQVSAGYYEIPGTSNFVTTSDAFPKPLRQILKLGDTWYAFVNHQEYDHATIGGIWYSTDLVTWNENTGSRGYELEGTAFVVGSEIVCIGYHWTYDVEEGIDFTDSKYKITISSGGSVSYTSIPETPYFSPRLYSGGYYYGYVFDGVRRFARTSDFVSITNGDAEPYNENIGNISFGNGKFWYANHSFTYNLAYAMYSTDGLSWSSPVTLQADYYVYTGYTSQVFADGEFVVHVNPDAIFKTTDGATYAATYLDSGIAHLEWARPYRNLHYNSNSGKYYLFGWYEGAHPLYMAVSEDAESWEDATPSGDLKIAPNCFVNNGNDVVTGITEGVSYPFTYGISGINVTLTTHGLTSFDSLVDMPIDFALIP